MNRKHIYIISILVVFFGMHFNSMAQGVAVSGTVTDAKSGETLVGAYVNLVPVNKATVTGQNGLFEFKGVKPGTYQVIVAFVGYAKLRQNITVGDQDLVVQSLSLSPVSQELQGIVVSALRPDLAPKVALESQGLREANVRDEGEIMRNLPGVDAVRRGPIGLDPSVRGLRETEVGFYVDGTRMFPAGPARMDSPLSHYDPEDVKSIEVVKGSYALLWLGNLSAVRVTTRGIPEDGNAGLLHGRLAAGYNSNLNSQYESAALQGRKGAFGYLIQGNTRQGHDYTSGDGTKVPADFHSSGVRGQANYQLSPNSSLTFSGGIQYQRDADYPGRLLDAKYFHTYDGSLKYHLERAGKTFRALDIQAYYNKIDHQMDNHDKPTAKADSMRMPPFPLRIVLNAHSHTTGGNVLFTMVPQEDWTIKLGGNFYSSYKKAVREIDRADMEKHLFTDLAWPGATVTMGGLFAQVVHPLSTQWNLSATVRGDVIYANADTASEFFTTQVSDQLSSSHAVMSGALTLTFSPDDHWSYAVGLGSAARSADASELYSDRFPSSKAQTSAEFVGNPQLNPEKNLQADLWIDGNYDKLSLSANLFARKMTDYITLEPTDLPKRLPLSPNTVYSYRNGTADFYGFEFSGAYRILPVLRLDLGLSYLWGEDQTVDEPALGVSPFRTDTRLRYGRKMVNGL